MNNRIFSPANWDIRQGDYISNELDYTEGTKMMQKDKKKKLAGVFISAGFVVAIMLMKVLNYTAAIKL
ncbi:MAG: hypothetical protein HRU80_00345 [Ignavibacteriales bacterium]|nr:hypothetical protein [Ignavibacteriaceae bacterium]MCK6613715.1 hypothetical protein [Ignavibacteriaceae bacterium]QOJ27391.1 MAG: hypothetical protein HRU80_00345 [Ignavibacteriales bacterium]